MRTANEKGHQSISHHRLIFDDNRGVHFGNNSKKYTAAIHRAVGRTDLLVGADPDWRWSGSSDRKIL